MSKIDVRATLRPASGPAEAAASGDRLVHVFNELRDRLVSTLMFVVGNAEDAQDAAQETFIKCWRSRDGIADVQDLSSWIFRVGINAAKDMRRSAWKRKAKSLAEGTAMLLQANESPTGTAEKNESLTRLRAAIHDLPPSEKEVFLLRQNGDLTYEQIAEMRGAPVGTVKTQMRTALQRLRAVLA